MASPFVLYYTSCNSWRCPGCLSTKHSNRPWYVLISVFHSSISSFRLFPCTLHATLPISSHLFLSIWSFPPSPCLPLLLYYLSLHTLQESRLTRSNSISSSAIRIHPQISLFMSHLSVFPSFPFLWVYDLPSLSSYFVLSRSCLHLLLSLLNLSTSSPTFILRISISSLRE